MSTQKGNTKRARPQKYQNGHAFKNDLHDKSPKTKLVNAIRVVNVCERCKKIIEWKIKYKKYKPLKAPAKCTRCEQKVIKHAYHIMCGPCALHRDVCPKCGEKSELVRDEPEEEAPKLDRELRLMLKKLPERKRRTFMRYMNRKVTVAGSEKSGDTQPSSKAEGEENESSDSDDESKAPAQPLTRDDLLEKLKSLMISKKNKSADGDESGSDLVNFDDSDYNDDDDDDDD